MYHFIVRQKLRRAFADINAGRYERIVPIPAVHLIVNLSGEPYRVLRRGGEEVGDTLAMAGSFCRRPVRSRPIRRSSSSSKAGWPTSPP